MGVSVTCKGCGHQVNSKNGVCSFCGQRYDFSSELSTAKELLRSGRKIDAIQEVRIVTGMDLGSAKNLVESWESDSA